MKLFQKFMLPVVAFALLATSGRAMFPNPTIVSNGLDDNEQATIAPINATIPPDFVLDGPVPPLAAAIEALPADEQAAAIDQLSPERFGFFTTTQAFNNATFEIMAMDAYLASGIGPDGTFLGGNGGLDSSGLAVNDPNFLPGLNMMHSKMLAWNPDPRPAGVLSDIAADELGGTDMRDRKDMKSMSSYGESDPWHTFVRGNVVLADDSSHQDIAHFDYTTSSVVIGTDYRINQNFLVGLTASFAHTDASLDTNGSSATVDSYSPGLYASYADGGWYANFIGDYVHNVYTQERVIQFLGETATSAPTGNEGIVNLDGGYQFRHGALRFGPLAGLQYTHLSLSGYDENGSIANLSVQSQDTDSLRGRLGGDVRYLFQDGSILITPHFSASYQHEFMDQARGINSSFSAGGGDFRVQTPHPDRDSALITLGADADLTHSLSVFTDYLVQVGQDNYFGQSVQAGVKIGF